MNITSNLTNSADTDEMLHLVASHLGLHCLLKYLLQITGRERSGSVVECLTRYRGAAGSSLTGLTALLSLSKTQLS